MTVVKNESFRAKIAGRGIKMLGNIPVAGHKMKNGKIKMQRIRREKEWKCPKGYLLKEIELKNCKAELLVKEKEYEDLAILQIHGGGYVERLSNRYRTAAGLYSEVSKGATVLTVDYRTAPENKYPAAIEDVVDAFEWLLTNGFTEQKIIVAGDSAGGGLALALGHYLKEHKREMPLGIITMSAWTNLECSFPSYQDNFKTDPVFGNSQESLIYTCPYAEEEEKQLSYVSPFYGDFKGFPPMLIQVGTKEMLLDDSVKVAQKAKEAGVNVTLSVYEGMFHIFQMAMLLIPESKNAWREIGYFIGKLKNKKI